MNGLVLVVFLVFVPSSALGGVTGLISNATDDSEPDVTVAATVENMLQGSNLNVSQDVQNMLGSLLSKKLNPHTVRGILIALHNEIPGSQQDDYVKFATKFSGLQEKKMKLLSKMNKILSDSDSDKEELTEAMRPLSVSAIIEEVKTSAISQNQLQRLTSIVQRLKR